MRKTLLTVAVIAAMSATSALAQKKVHFGIKGGANVSTLATDENPTPIVGYNAGITLDYSLSKHWAVYSGLELVQKGFKEEVNGYKRTARPLYLQLPAHLAVRIGIGAVHLVPQTGLYAAYGVGGKVSSNAPNTDAVSYFDNNKKFDFGLGAALGVEFKHLGVKLGSDIGLVNVNSNANSKNVSAYLAVGLKF